MQYVPTAPKSDARLSMPGDGRPDDMVGNVREAMKVILCFLCPPVHPGPANIYFEFASW